MKKTYCVDVRDRNGIEKEYYVMATDWSDAWKKAVGWAEYEFPGREWEVA